MNPISKKIYNKLSQEDKTELKSEKVELALELGGLKSYASNLKSKFSTYQNKFRVVDNMVGELQQEAKELDKLMDNFNRELKEQQKEGNRQANELGVKFIDTPVGREWERIAGDVLSGNYDAIKRGLKIDIS
jgi:chromosome segregation ATPase